MTPPASSRVDPAAAPSLRVEFYPSPAALPETARQLLREGARQDFHCSLTWFETLLEHSMAEGIEPRFYAVFDANGPGATAGSPTAVAALPLRAPLIRERWIRSKGLQSLADYFTAYHGLILADSVRDPDPIVRALVRAMLGERPAWDGFKLACLAHDDTVFPSLVRILREAGMVVQPFKNFINWYLEVNGRSADEYFAGLPSQLRNTIKRKTKTLETSGRMRIQVVTGGAGLDAAVEDYSRVFSSSWKVEEPYAPGFVPALIRACAAMGWLRLGLLHVDGEPAAAQFWVVVGGTASIFRLAYDDRFLDQSVGTILTAHLMRHVIDVDKVATVDYGIGNDPYKRDWMSHRRERWGILALNPRTLPGLLGVVRHVGGRAVKRAVVLLLETARRFWRGGAPPPPARRSVRPVPPPQERVERTDRQ